MLEEQKDTECGDVNGTRNELQALQTRMVGVYFKCEKKPFEDLKRRVMQTMLHF